MKQSELDLEVVARAPFEIFYQGKAKGVSAANSVGEFDILPGHTDFFSMLLPGEVVITTDKEPVTIKISNGIVTVRDNQVTLFLNM